MIDDFRESDRLRQRSHTLIPGGAHTYAKGDDQYPLHSPGFIVRGKGCHVWDADGNEYIEYGMGLRSVGLGHAYRPVIAAAARQMMKGQNFTRPATIEIEAAEALLECIPGAEMVKFAKNGSDVTTAAVRLARAITGRDMVAICGDHPFYSVDDWFIGATAMSSGIPAEHKRLTVKFAYNQLDTLRQLFQLYPGQIACVMMEAATQVEPQQDYLQQVIDLTHAHGAIFILDENITGFRYHLGGAQAKFGIVPDLSTFGKAMANGFALAALAGKREFMLRGGIEHEHERVFLLSTTHGAETSALAACIATIHAYRKEQVIDHLYAQGEKLRAGIAKAAESEGISEHFGTLGYPCNLIYYTRDPAKQPSQAFRTLFLQETIKRGLLMPSLVDSFAHKDDDITRTLDAIAEALRIYRKALDEGIEKYLIGRPVKPVFRPFN